MLSFLVVVLLPACCFLRVGVVLLSHQVPASLLCVVFIRQASTSCVESEGKGLVVCSCQLLCVSTVLRLRAGGCMLWCVSLVCVCVLACVCILGVCVVGSPASGVVCGGESSISLIFDWTMQRWLLQKQRGTNDGCLFYHNFFSICRCCAMFGHSKGHS